MIFLIFVIICFGALSWLILTMNSFNKKEKTLGISIMLIFAAFAGVSILTLESRQEFKSNCNAVGGIVLDTRMKNTCIDPTAIIKVNN